MSTETKLTINGTRFGDIDFENRDILEFSDGLIGFPNVHRFILLNPREDGVFRWLQSLEEPSLAFLLVDPSVYVPDYGPTLSASDANALELTPETPRIVYTTANIPRGKPEEMTINLAGPILINGLTQKAKQVVVEDAAYTTRYRVFPSAETASERTVA